MTEEAVNGSRDCEIFKEILQRAGIVFQERENSIDIVAKAGPNNRGYAGFEASFTFNDDGSLKHVAVWE